MHRNQHKESSKNGETKIYVPNERIRKKKSTLNKTVMSNLPDKEFKVIFIKMVTKLGKRRDEYSENFTKI